MIEVDNLMAIQEQIAQWCPIMLLVEDSFGSRKNRKSSNREEKSSRRDDNNTEVKFSLYDAFSKKSGKKVNHSAHEKKSNKSQSMNPI